LRVAATDTAGRSGSADYEVIAELVPAGALKVSSLVLGLSRAGGFVPRMLFGAEPVALGYVDIYGTAELRDVAVAAEIARTVDGPPVMPSIPGAVRTVAGEPRLIATVALPIGALARGDYVVRLTVSGAGQSAGRVYRTLRKN
jgi:hypothetical protein